jgi:hypothetical protein
MLRCAKISGSHFKVEEAHSSQLGKTGGVRDLVQGAKWDNQLYEFAVAIQALDGMLYKLVEMGYPMGWTQEDTSDKSHCGLNE